jgi:hypothetical protein
LNPNSSRTIITDHLTRVYDARTGEKKRYFSTFAQGPKTNLKAELGERSFVTFGGIWPENCNPFSSEQST